MFLPYSKSYLSFILLSFSPFHAFDTSFYSLFILISINNSHSSIHPHTLCKGGLAHHNNPIHWVKSSFFFIQRGKLFFSKNYFKFLVLWTCNTSLATNKTIIKIQSQESNRTIGNTQSRLMIISWCHMVT